MITIKYLHLDKLCKEESVGNITSTLRSYASISNLKVISSFEILI